MCILYTSVHNDHDITQVIALVGFIVILNDDISYTYEHFYTIDQIEPLSVNACFYRPNFLKQIHTTLCKSMLNNDKPSNTAITHGKRTDTNQAVFRKVTK